MHILEERGMIPHRKGIATDTDPAPCRAMARLFLAIKPHVLEVPLERAMRFELTTLTLARLCSTPELRPLPWVRGR